MDFRYPAEAEAFRAEVRDFLKDAVTPEYLQELKTLDVEYDGHDEPSKNFIEKLKEKGYLTLHWPKAYGGQGRSIFEQAVFAEEMVKAGGSSYIVGSVGLNMVAPALMVYGSEEHKTDLLPRIANLELKFAQMFTEPNAGSDLASLQTTAIRDGDDYIVNGQKIFITWAYQATHGYLLARTDPSAAKHKGLSLFLLDLKTPGITLQRLKLIDGKVLGIYYLEDVRVPKSAMIGEENRGWYHAAVTLDFERAGMRAIVQGEEAVASLIEYARKTVRNGKPLSQDPGIRAKLIEAYRDAKLHRGLGMRVLDLQARNKVANFEASELSLHTREAGGRLAETKQAVYGMYTQLLKDSPYVQEEADGAHGWWTLAGRHAAGTMEVQRNIIAQRGLGLPR